MYNSVVVSSDLRVVANQNQVEQINRTVIIITAYKLCDSN